jgi:hypothetical protein
VYPKNTKLKHVYETLQSKGWTVDWVEWRIGGALMTVVYHREG